MRKQTFKTHLLLLKQSKHWSRIGRKIPRKVCIATSTGASTAELAGYLLVVVRFKAVGNAPIMKQNFYKINSTNRFQAVIQFLRKELGWQAGEPLVSNLHATQNDSSDISMQFTYINLAFSPAPDDTVSNLYKVYLPPECSRLKC